MPAARKLTAADYLAYDASHPGKHEFWFGQIVAMAGASPRHSKLTFDLIRALGPALDARGCDGFSSDTRVRLPEGNYVYPDVTVACDPDFDDDRPPTLRNPLLIIEVSSPSTQHVDRTKKLAAYVQLPSLQVYWLFEQDERAVTLFDRSGDLWAIRYLHGEDAVIETPLFDQTFALGDLYRRLGLDDLDSPAGADADAPGAEDRAQV
jgi:Uma2 family endonuclease